MRKTAAFAVAFAVTVTGCLTDPEDLGSVEQEAAGCPSWGCGENTPLMETWDITELEARGQDANKAGIRIDRMIQGSNVYDVHVDGMRLQGIGTAGQPPLVGTALIGAKILVDTPMGPYEIVIENVSNVTQFWTGQTQFAESYRLTYTKFNSGTNPRNVCPNPPRSRLDPSGGLWGNTVEALIFTGDRYDPTDRTVTAASYAEAGTWFNIACAGSALAKLHLNRYTTASATSTHYAPWEARQAMLKMYSSHVCKNGGAYTVAGTPLHYENAAAWFKLTGFEASLEGYWGKDGAICLENHRLDSIFGLDILADCPGVPKCSALIPGFPGGGWPAGAEFLTANP